MHFRSQLPPEYSQLLPTWFWNLDVPETKATCDNCAMAPGRTRSRKTYQPDLKCCTFYPFLPNFLVGAILSQDRYVEGQKVIRDLIARRQYALPIGLVPPVRYQLDFVANKAEGFGQREDWLCPYYNREKELCNVWHYRGVVCTTYFCKSSFAKAGEKFWAQTSDYLSYFEMALMEECLVMLDFSPRQVSDLLGYLNRETGTAAEKKSWVIPEAKSKELWNGYYKEQEQFYINCYNLVRKLKRPELEELMGELGSRLEQQVKLSAKGLGLL